MNLNSRTKFYFFFLFIVFTNFCLSQNSDITKEQDSVINKQSLGYYAYEFSLPITTGDKFAGQGLTGKAGFNMKLHVFVYKGLFVSGTFGANYFKVKNREVVGNYNKTTSTHQYLSLGYEISPWNKLRMGLSASVLGASYFKNKSGYDYDEAIQRDSGQIRSYDFYVNYMLTNELALFLNYAYRNDKMNIKVPTEIQEQFSNANFHNIGIGIRVCFGKKDIISAI